MPATYLEDRLAIHDLFVRYATALDNGEVETVVACFTADAVLESPATGAIPVRCMPISRSMSTSTVWPRLVMALDRLRSAVGSSAVMENRHPG